jgi:uncharacterized protein (DUF924 family)
MTAICTPQEVYSFWFEKCGREDWFTSSPGLDEEMKRQFRDTHLQLASGPSDQWRATPANRLALVVVLDQFPRNIYRGTALAFATDGLARAEAELALECGDDKQVPEAFRLFFYLPFEHAEDIALQDRAVALFADLGDEQYLDYAQRHRAVIATHGRFPHRNQALGRRSTAAELQYLAETGAGF